MAAMFVRALGITDEMLLMNQKIDTIPKLSDKTLVSPWALNSVEFALDNGIMVGVGGNRFAPQNYAERQQAAVVIYRYLMNKEQLLNVKSDFTVGKPFITLGSTKKDVLEVLGRPDSFLSGYTNYNTFVMRYNNPMLVIEIECTIDGVNDYSKVIGWWADTQLNNKIILGPKDPTAPPFTIGSSRNDVAKAMGAPKEIFNYRPSYIQGYIPWTYPDNSIVFFDENRKVTGYINNGSLKVDMGKKDPEAPPINWESSMQDVINALGTPDIVNFDYKIEYYDIWVPEYTYYRYKNSYIGFDKNQKLVSFDNNDNLKIDFGSIDPAFPGIRADSKIDEILKAMGTPERIDMITTDRWNWFYGNSYITVDSNGTIISWEDKGNLKINKNIYIVNAPIITVGSTKQDVVNLLGTADQVRGQTWYYGNTRITFGSNDQIYEIFMPIDGMLSKSVKDPLSPGFTFGATRDDVVKAIGIPAMVDLYDGQTMDYIRWSYNKDNSFNSFSDIYFDFEWNVVYWQDNLRIFKFAQPAEYNPEAQPITLGSTIDDIIRAMGTPYKLSSPNKGGYWFYPEGMITVTDGKVTSWGNFNGKLKVFLRNPVEGSSFKYGSTIDEVTRAMGTPQSMGIYNLDRYMWTFDGGWVGFDLETERVTSWGGGENLRIVPDTSLSSAMIIFVGASRDDVFKVMGVPDRIDFEEASYLRGYSYWCYGQSKITFNKEGFVTSWVNIDNNLILDIID